MIRFNLRFEFLKAVGIKFYLMRFDILEVKDWIEKRQKHFKRSHKWHIDDKIQISSFEDYLNQLEKQ